MSQPEVHDSLDRQSLWHRSSRGSMFSETTRHSDKIHCFKDYEAEVQRLIAIASQTLRSDARRRSHHRALVHP